MATGGSRETKPTGNGERISGNTVHSPNFVTANSSVSPLVAAHHTAYMNVFHIRVNLAKPGSFNILCIRCVSEIGYIPLRVSVPNFCEVDV